MSAGVQPSEPSLIGALVVLALVLLARLPDGAMSLTYLSPAMFVFLLLPWALPRRADAERQSRAHPDKASKATSAGHRRAPRSICRLAPADCWPAHWQAVRRHSEQCAIEAGLMPIA